MGDESEVTLHELQVRLERLSDKEAIRDVIHRYCRAVDRCDLELHKSCYWPDSIDDHGFFGGNGIEFCEYVVPVLKEVHSSIHAITNTIIDFEGDRAFCESQWSVIHRLVDEEDSSRFLDYWHQGRYLDVMEKRNGEWRIKVRHLVKDMDRLQRTNDLQQVLSAIGGPRSDEAGNLAPYGARFPDDPVYLKYGVKAKARTRTPVKNFWQVFQLIKDAL